MTLSDDCQERGAPDWGASAPAVNPICEEQATSSSPDFGDSAPTVAPWIDSDAVQGLPDWGDSAPTDAPWIDADALQGLPDWGDSAPTLAFWIADDAFVGLPDWGFDVLSSGKALRMSDLELAARGNDAFARFLSGKLQYYDSFDTDYIHWNTSSSGVGSSATISNTAARTGDNSYKLTCGAALGNFGRMGKTFHPFPFARYGVGFFWSEDSETNQLEIEIDSQVLEKHYKWTIKYKIASEELYYVDSGGSDVLIRSVKRMRASGVVHNFNFIQVVVDHDTGNYVRVIFGGTSHVINEAGETETVVSGQNDIRVRLFNRNIDSSGSIVYIDDFVLTYDEL